LVVFERWVVFANWPSVFANQADVMRNGLEICGSREARSEARGIRANNGKNGLLNWDPAELCGSAGAEVGRK
jgi:hypothetical protein